MTNGRRSRNKGARGELEFAHEMTRIYGIEARRGRQYHGGPGTPDVVVDLPKVHFEVKRTETLSLYKAMEQAIADAGEDVPVVVHRRNHKDWLVVVRLEDLGRLAVQTYLTLAEKN